jgi:hypothetical protein
VFSVILLFAGLFNATEATLGVALIGMGCGFGILARIVQAGEQHSKQIEWLEFLSGLVEKEAPSKGEMSKRRAEKPGNTNPIDQL